MSRRAAAAIWILEEAGVPYTLHFIDIARGDQKRSELLSLNPMGKLPTLVDGDTVVTELAAIGLYLADRYAPGKLAPALDDPRRGTYLRWDYRESAAGWGSFDAMIAAMKRAVSERFILGDTFSMADVIFGGTLRYMLRVGLLQPHPEFTSYAERLAARPALRGRTPRTPPWRKRTA